MTAPTASPVGPPAGADLVCEWETCRSLTRYRVIFGADRFVTDTQVRVYATVVQLADGSIDQCTVEEPSVNVSDSECDVPPLNLDQARELAALLLEAVREIEGWLQ